MINKKSGVVGCCLVAGVLLSGSMFISVAGAADFYVSPKGSDDNTGTLKRPFRTVLRARDAVRKVNKGMKEDIHVYIRGGVYYLTEPIKLGSQDSGFNGHRVIYSGYKGERPQLVGGVPVTKWESWEKGIMRADVGKDTMFWGLSVNGKRAKMASSVRYKGLVPFSTRNVHAFFGGSWMSEYINVTGFNEKKQPIFEFKGSKYTGKRAVLQGYYKFIKKPGEWALDSDTGYLYYYPENKSDLEHVIYPTVHAIFRVAGESRSARVKMVSIENLDMKLTDFNANMRSYSGISEGGYSYHNADRANTLRTALVVMENADKIEVRFCEMLEGSINGVSIYGPSEGNLVYGCRIHDIGYVGVYLAGYKIERATPYENKFNRVENNEIFDISGAVNHTCGVLVYQSGDNEISHNMIYHSRRYGISVKGARYKLFKSVGLADVKFEDQWKYLHSNRNRIVGNYVFDLCRASVDGGGIECWGGGRDNLMANNIVVNAYMGKPHGALRGRSLFLDDGSNYWTLRDNVAWNTRLPSLNESVYACGVNEVITNNVLDIGYCSAAGVVLNAYAERSRDHVFERNILYSSFDKVIKKDGTAGDEAPKDIAIIQALRGIFKSEKDNLIYLKVGKPCYIVKYFGGKDRISLDQWREAPKEKRGKGIRVQDPCFVNAAEHDYRLRDDSPAFEMGIHSIATDQIGLNADYPFAPANDPLKMVALKANGHDVYLETAPGQEVKLSIAGRTEKWFVADLSKASITLVSDHPEVVAVKSGNILSLQKRGRAVITATVKLDGVTKTDDVVIYNGMKRTKSH